MSNTIHYFDECVVCHEPNPSHLFKPCNHKCICTTCVNTYTKSRSLETCPLCREKYCSIERDDSKPKNVTLMDEEQQLALALRISLQEAKEEEEKRKKEESIIQQQILAIDLKVQQESELLEHKRVLSSIVDLVRREAVKIENGLHQSLATNMMRGAQFAREESELRLIQNVENAFSRIKESIKLRRSVQFDECSESIGFSTTPELGSTHQLSNAGFSFKSANGIVAPSTTSSTFSFAPTWSSNTVNFQTKPFVLTSPPASFSFGITSLPSNGLFSNAATAGTSGSGKNSNSNQSNQDQTPLGGCSTTSTFNFGHGQQTATSEGAMAGPKAASTSGLGSIPKASVNFTSRSGNTGFRTTQKINPTGSKNPFKSLTHSGIFTFGTVPVASTVFVTQNHNTDVISSSSVERDSDADEAEFDPMPFFAPIIPLPDEVPVITGEEDEEVLFCARAKLFRFADREWKERGVGNVKLLKSKEGKIRLLMRREKVHKICANHLLQKDMQLSVMPNNEKAYMWVAHDYADEEIRLEKLCIRFRTVDEAMNFKENFDRAKNSLSSEATKTSDVNFENGTEGISTELSKTDSAQNGPTVKVNGFTFTSLPTISKSLAKDSTADTPDRSTTKTSPFASFSFGMLSESANEIIPTNPAFNFKFPPSSATTSIPRVVANAAPTPVRAHVPASTNSAQVDAVSRVSKPLSELFRPASGSWECKNCWIRNDQSDEYCVACKTPSNPSLPRKLNPGSLRSSSQDTSSPTFSRPQNQTSGFHSNAQLSTSEKFTFPLTNNFGANKPSFNSGVQSSCTSPKNEERRLLTFATPEKALSFQFQNKALTSKLPESRDDDVVEKSKDAHSASTIPLPEKIEVKTGEENEEILCSHTAKLYRYYSSAREWIEKGVGNIKLLRHVETKKLRFLMTCGQVPVLWLNHDVSSSLVITPKSLIKACKNDDRTWTWWTGDQSEGKMEMTQFACCFTTPEEAKQFKKSVDDACKSQSDSLSPSFESTALNQTR